MLLYIVSLFLLAVCGIALRFVTTADLIRLENFLAVQNPNP